MKNAMPVTSDIFPTPNLKAPTDPQAKKKKRMKPGHNHISNPQYNTPLALRYTDEQVIDAVYKCKGLTAAVCVELDCTYQQLYSYMKTRDDVQKAMKEAREQIVAEAERVMVDLLHSPAPNIQLDAAKFILKHQGRTVGWGDSPVIQQNITIADQKAQILQIFGIDEKA